MALTLLNALFFACFALGLEWARVTNTSLISTGRDALGDLKSIIEGASNARDFAYTKAATAIETIVHSTSSAPLDALKSLLLYYVLFVYALKAYRHVRARGLCRCIRAFTRDVVKVRFPSVIVMTANHMHAIS